MRARLRRPRRGWFTTHIELKPGQTAGNHIRVQLDFTQQDGYKPTTVELDRGAAFALANELVDYFECRQSKETA